MSTFTTINNFMQNVKLINTTVEFSFEKIKPIESSHKLKQIKLYEI